MPKFDVTTIGEGQLRYSVPAGYRLEEASALNVHVAGTEANVVSLLSRLGWRTGWVSALPNNPLGRRVLNAYKNSGVDVSAVSWVDGARLATYYVEYATPPRSTQVYYDRANTAFTQLQSDSIDWAYLLDTRLLHISGLTLPLSDSIQSILSEAVKRAKEAGVKVSFDMNYRSRLWTVEAARQAVEPILKEVDLLFFARGDAERIFGLPNDPETILHALGQICPASHIVVSLSSDGLIGWDRSQMTHVSPYDVHIIDRIGAGDAMVGGVIHGWLNGKFERGLQIGACTSAMALAQHGDALVTTLDEIEMLLESGGASGITR